MHFSVSVFFKTFSLSRQIPQVYEGLQVFKLVFGFSFVSCGDAMCTIAASTSFPEPFETPTDRKRLGWVHKKFSGTRHSDHIALLSAYQAWEDAR